MAACCCRKGSSLNQLKFKDQCPRPIELGTVETYREFMPLGNLCIKWKLMVLENLVMK